MKMPKLFTELLVKRHAYSELVSMASSIVSEATVPDSSAQGLYRAAPERRNQAYLNFAGNHT